MLERDRPGSDRRVRPASTATSIDAPDEVGDCSRVGEAVGSEQIVRGARDRHGLDAGETQAVLGHRVVIEDATRLGAGCDEDGEAAGGEISEQVAVT